MGPLSSVISLSIRDCKRLSCSRTSGGPTTQLSPRRLWDPKWLLARRLCRDRRGVWNKTARSAVGAASTGGVGRYVKFDLRK